MTETVEQQSKFRRLLTLVAIVVAAGILGALTAGLITMRQPKTYSATLTLVANGATSTDGSETLGRTVVALVKSDAISNDLIAAVPSDLTPQQIQNNLDAERPPGSSVVNITYTDTDEAQATATITALPPIFEKRLKMVGKTGGGTTPGAKVESGAPDVSIWDNGQGAVTTNSPPVMRNAAVGGVLAASIAIVAILLWSSRRRNRSESSYSQETDRASA